MKEVEENILSEPNKDEDEENNYLKKIVKLNDYQLEHKYLFRICLLGNAGVGKTSLITRFCDNSFKENYNNTIGVDFRLVTLRYNFKTAYMGYRWPRKIPFFSFKLY